MKITTSGFIFQFIKEDEDEVRSFPGFCWCNHCDRVLDHDYCQIITSLEEANLLPEGFKRLCCMCYFFDKIGILYLRKQYDGWDTDGSILILNFDLWEKDYDKAFNKDYDDYILKLRIHDYEKILFS